MILNILERTQISELAYVSFQSKSVWFLPWIVQQGMELLIGVGLLLVYSMEGANYTFGQLTAYFFLLCIASTMIYAVLSHYIILRKAKKHTNAIINSVMDGTTCYIRT